MRKIFAAEMVALAFIGCSRDKIAPVTPENVDAVSPKTYVPLSIVAGNPSDPDTRTEMNGTTPLWSPGDALGVTSLSPDEYGGIGGGELMNAPRTRMNEDDVYRADLYLFDTDIETASVTATFTGEVAISSDGDEPKTFYAYYPYPAIPEQPEYQNAPYYVEDEGDILYYDGDDNPLEDEEAYNAAMEEYELAMQAYSDYYENMPVYSFLSDGIFTDGREAYAPVYVKNRQHPTPNSFDGTADVLVSKPFQVTEETTTIPNLQFARMTSVLKIVFQDKTTDHVYTGEHPACVRVAALGESEGSPEVRSSYYDYLQLAGPGYLDLVTPDLEPLGYSITEGSDEDQSIVTADFSGTHSFEVGADHAVYLLVYPQMLQAGTILMFSFEESENYKRVARRVELSKDLPLNYGKMTTLTVQLFDRENENMLVVAPEAIVLSENELNLEENGDCPMLSASILPEELGDYLPYDEWKNIQWTSSDETVVSIEREQEINNRYPFTVRARIVPVGQGTATVTVSYANLTATCEVTVGPGSPIIEFVDSDVKAICVSKWDTNGDGELSQAEAAKVTSIPGGSQSPFYDESAIDAFPEFAYFTGLEVLPEYAFFSCENLTSMVVPENVVTVGQQAFGCCDRLQSVKFLGDKVTSLGDKCFREDYALTQFEGPIATEDGRCLVIGGVLETFLPNGLTSYAIPSSVQALGANPFYLLGKSGMSVSLSLPDGIESIPDMAFVNCVGLSSIEFGSGLKTIGKQAFDRCTNLSGLQIPDTVTSIGEYAFNQCKLLTGILIPETVVSIGASAFYGCVGLTEIRIPGSVKQVSDRAFYGCTSLASIELDEGVETLGYSAFSQSIITEISLPSTIQDFSTAFSNCSRLTSFTVPDQIGTLSSNAFSGCSALAEVNLGQVTSIGYRAFGDCSSLQSITLPNAVRSVGDNAFANCSKLVTIVFGTGLEELGNGVFEGCTSLTAMQIPATVTSLGTRVFYGCRQLQSVEFLGNAITAIGSDMFNSCSNLRSVSLPSSLTSIGSSAFQNCTSLANLTIPDSVSSIGSYAFSNTGMTSFAVPESLTAVPNNLFQETSSLLSVTIPASVKSIGTRAFDMCTNLSSVTLEPGSTLESVNSYAFNQCNNLTSIELPDCVTSLGEAAFRNCEKLQSFHIPAGVTRLPSYLLGGTKALTSISIPSNVTVIGDNCFKLSGLSSVHIGENITTIGESAFFQCTSLQTVTIDGGGSTVIGTSAFSNCTALANLTLGSGVKGINSKAFKLCTSLTSVNIPGSVVSLGQEAFSYCQTLTSVTLSEGLQTIYRDCFLCSALSEVVIPSTVTRLYSGAFYCGAGSSTAKTLVRVRLLGTTPPAFTKSGSYLLFLAKDTSTFVVEIPEAAAEAYQADSYWSTNWGSYFRTY